ncbi:LysR family transcriptional regulator [Candidatus Enterococcus murrayae]|uniref:LysR family transcriptional regulator n=1 Tax=Candidatus Enterococcus murrayae TaxID=2815321 RepID=A0ABS3HGS6_9ENTE|nr:LysR family transcriptional regulator [Enterococcus sp. MJM16]MBO0452656.1 LysR family transcriptional regulator [Enterococcus sp. MJM16]
MDIQKLRYFVEIARTENISKAAKALYIGQPSLSMALKRMEEELDTTLFDRKGKSLQLNENGRKILVPVKEIVELMDQVEAIASKRQEHHLSLAVAEDVVLHNFKDVFEREHPDIVIDFCFVTTQEAIEMLELGQVDLAITTTKVDLKNIEPLFQFELPLLLCIPKSNPLSNKKKLSFLETRDETFIFSLFQKSFIAFINSYAAANNYIPKLEYATADPLFVFRLLKQGRGITAISEYDEVIVEEMDIAIVEVTDVARKIVGYSMIAEADFSPELKIFKDFFIHYYS